VLPNVRDSLTVLTEPFKRIANQITLLNHLLNQYLFIWISSFYRACWREQLVHCLTI